MQTFDKQLKQINQDMYEIFETLDSIGDIVNKFEEKHREEYEQYKDSIHNAYRAFVALKKEDANVIENHLEKQVGTSLEKVFDLQLKNDDYVILIGENIPWVGNSFADVSLIKDEISFVPHSLVAIDLYNTGIIKDDKRAKNDDFLESIINDELVSQLKDKDFDIDNFVDYFLDESDLQLGD